jgi:hypothetical protein
MVQLIADAAGECAQTNTTSGGMMALSIHWRVMMSVDFIPPSPLFYLNDATLLWNFLQTIPIVLLNHWIRECIGVLYLLLS